MTSFLPTVRCFEPEGVDPEPEDCPEVLQIMRTTKSYQLFGRANVPEVDVRLPLEIANGKLQPPAIGQWSIRWPITNLSCVGDQTCVATVDNIGPPAIESWHHIWEQMVAVDGMCSRRGLEGVAFALGKSTFYYNKTIEDFRWGSNLESLDKMY